jgi:hypothetical protein
MTRDDIIRMARESGIGPVYGYESIERFAALVAAAEREACAKLCEEQRNMEWVRANIPLITHDPANTMASKCAAAIRARGETQ